jgi:hypothetical protein
MPRRNLVGWRMIVRRRADPKGSSCSVIGPPFDPRTRLHDLRQFERGHKYVSCLG